MAIKRCPYCRAIIDEVDRYCNNCGTQLLFPEDEEVEEEIPGERIVEVEGKEDEGAPPERVEPVKETLREPEKPRLTPGTIREKISSGEMVTSVPATSEELEEIARLMSVLEKQETKPEPTPFDEKEFSKTPKTPPPEIKMEPESHPLSNLQEGQAVEEEPSFEESAEFGTADFQGSEPQEARTEREERPYIYFEEHVPARRRGHRGGFKARFFDFLFVTLIWVVALWLASRILDLPLFDVIRVSLLPVVAFLAVLLASYFFLFLYFLGQTLGDRVTSR